MKRKPERVADYLRHIEEAVLRILDYTADIDDVGFLKSTLIQDAVIRNFEIIGEACRNIEKLNSGFFGQYPHVPFKKSV